MIALGIIIALIVGFLLGSILSAPRRGGYQPRSTGKPPGPPPSQGGTIQRSAKTRHLPLPSEIIIPKAFDHLRYGRRGETPEDTIRRLMSRCAELQPGETFGGGFFTTTSTSGFR